MTKHSPKEDRREQILKAAIACFARKGYHLTTMDDIVAESGLSKGSLYWHYKNKKDLFLSIMASYFEQIGAGLEAAVARPADLTATAKLNRLAEAFLLALSPGTSDPILNVFIDFYAETRHDAEVNAFLRRVLTPYLEMLSAIIQQGIAAGEFKPIDARHLAVALMAAYDGLYLYRMMLADQYDWRQVSQVFVNTLLHGLRA